MDPFDVDGQLDRVATADAAARLQAGNADRAVVQRLQVLVEVLRVADVFGVDLRCIDRWIASSKVAGILSVFEYTPGGALVFND